jgi:chromosomal replication initiator protein
MPDDVVAAIDALVTQSEGLRAQLLDERDALISRVRAIDAQLARLPRSRPPAGVVHLASRSASGPMPLTAADVGRPGEALNPRDVLHAVATYFHFSVAQVNGPDRHMSLARARHIAIYLARTLLGASYPELGMLFGGRDHTTIIAAYNKIAALLKEDGDVRTDVEALMDLLLEARGLRESARV